MKTKTLNLGLALLALTGLKIAGVYSACGQQILTNIAIPNGVGAVDVNAALNEIYLAGGQPAAQMVVVNGTDYSQTGVGMGNDVGVDVANNSYWSTGIYSGEANVWNSLNSSLADINLGYCPYNVSVDAPHRVVWIAAQCGAGNDPVWAINADTYAIIDGPIGTGGVENGLVVNPATGRLYIYPNGAVSKRVNPSTFAVTVNGFGQVLAANASANLLYANNNNPFTTLQIINGAPDPEVVLTNIPLPFAFRSPIGVNPVLNRIYIGYNTTNIIAILNATTGQSIGTISLGVGITSVGRIAVDASRNRIYAIAFGGGSTRLYVIQDTGAPSLNIAPFGNQSVLFWPAWATNYVLKSTTNLSSPNWVTVSDAVPVIAFTVTNTLPARFFRLQQQ